MNSLTTEGGGIEEPRVRVLEVTDEFIIAHLLDGRIIGVPVAWSWRLSGATPEQQANY